MSFRASCFNKFFFSPGCLPAAISQGAASHTLQYYAEGTTTCNSSDNFLQVLATGAYVDLGPRVTGEIVRI